MKTPREARHTRKPLRPEPAAAAGAVAGAEAGADAGPLAGGPDGADAADASHAPTWYNAFDRIKPMRVTCPGPEALATMPQTILQTILETKRQEVRELHRENDLTHLQAAAAAAPRARNFFSAVTKASPRGMNLIAEVKKASPSAGVLRKDFDPGTIAREYAAAGADAISVLTDRTYFQGDLEHLRAVRRAAELPVLRKDFLIDPWQIYESRAAGADAVLLIAAALSPGELLDLMILATELRMTVVLEVHEADELLQVRSMVGFPLPSYGLLGINNRNLATFRVDLGTTLRLAELAGEGVPLVSESGIRTRRDVKRLRPAGVKAILVGETLLRSESIAAAVEDLLGH